MNHTEIKTLGDLKATGYKSKSIKDELRDNLIEKLKNKQSVFEGMGIRPRKYSPLVDNLDPERLRQDLNNTRSAIFNMVKTLPTHDEYLQRVHEEKYKPN